MKHNGLTLTLALLVSPISSRQIPTKPGVWNPADLVADTGRAKSGERCGTDQGGVTCEDGLCCSDWGICGKGSVYCAKSTCQSEYGACETSGGEVPKDDLSEYLKNVLKNEKLNPEIKSRLDEIELTPEEAGDLHPLEVMESDELRHEDGDNEDHSWEEEITAQPSWEEESISQVSRQENDRPRFGSLPYGVELSSCRRSGAVALTFDDGPDATLTGELLDLLDDRGVKATFFVNGNNRGLLTDQGKAQHIDRMLASGHHIANHGWSHLDLNEISTETKRSEITLAEDALAEVMGAIPTYFRPPFGSCDSECLSILDEYGYHVIRWDVDTNDFRQDLQESKDTVSSAFASKDSAIVLAHDIHEMTVESLASFMIDTAEREGLELVTLGACMNDPMENWYRDPTTGGPLQVSSRAGSESLQLKQRIEDDEATSTSSLFTASPSTGAHTASKTSASCTAKDECVESDSQVKHTGTISEDEEDSGITVKTGCLKFALVVACAVGVFILS